MISALSLLGGILWSLGAAALPQMPLVIAACMLLCACVCSGLREQPAARAAAWLLLGQLLAGQFAARWLELALPPTSADARVLVQGQIEGVPERDGATWRFELQGRVLAGAGQSAGQSDGESEGEVARRFRLQWRDAFPAPRAGEQWRLLIRLTPAEPWQNFAGVDTARLAFRDQVHGHGVVLAGAGQSAGQSDGESEGEGEVARRFRLQWRDAFPAPRAGEHWRLLIRLTPAEPWQNFAGVDTARLAFRDQVHGHGVVLPSAMNELLMLAPAALHTVRARIAARAGDAVADPDAAALLTALAVGITGGLSADQWRVFNATGTTHLIAISGLHVTLFAWLAFRVARLAWRCLPLRPWLDRESFALWLGLAAAGGYALLAGWSVPTQRTWLMLFIYVLGRTCARAVSAGRLWSLALMLVLLSDITAPLAAGFWLSFVAVGVLLTFQTSPAAGWRPGVLALLRTQGAIMVALAPAGFALFGGVSLTGLIVNLVAIPIVSFVFVPVVLMGALGAWLWPPAGEFCFHAAAALYDLLWPGLAAAADLGGGLWRMTPAGWWYLLAVPAVLVWLCPLPRALRLTAACALLPLLHATPGPAPGTLHLQVIDAGRGSAVLLRTARQAVLFDTGDVWGTRGSRLAQTVLPALDASGLRAVDALILPVLDDDRARAAAWLALTRNVGRIWSPSAWVSALPVARCRAHAWVWEGWRWELDFRDGRCALSVHMANATLRLRAPRGSSTQWLESSSPGFVIALGGVPGSQARMQALRAWHGQGWRVFDTQVDGGLEIKWGQEGIRIRTALARHPYHWRRASAEGRRPPV